MASSSGVILTSLVGELPPHPPGFEDDPRIHFSTVSQTWQYEDDDGNEMEFDPTKRIWVPVLDEELVRAQQAAYSVAGVNEEEPAAPVVKRESKKRKEQDYTSNTDMQEGPSLKRSKTGSSNASNKPHSSKNTAVFVSNLPLDATAEEIAARFSRCGVLMEDDDGDPKVKLYADENGNFNGQALVVYFQEASVTLALSLLDEDELRIGQKSTVMHVKKAEYGHKGQTGANAPRVVDKKKATKRITKMHNKVAEWGVDDGFGPSTESGPVQEAPQGRAVVLKHMFTLEELEEDPTLLLDLKEDVREECSTLGDVTSVVLYDKEPEGIMTVKFRDPVSAEACILKMDGRFFAGRKVEARYLSGRQRFRRTGAGDDVDEEDEDDAEKKRLDDFAKWLTIDDKT